MGVEGRPWIIQLPRMLDDEIGVGNAGSALTYALPEKSYVQVTPETTAFLLLGTGA
jgi:hypothetical protein